MITTPARLAALRALRLDRVSAWTARSGVCRSTVSSTGLGLSPGPQPCCCRSPTAPRARRPTRRAATSRPQGPAGEIRVVPGAGGRLTAAGPFVLDFNRAYNPSCAYGAPERFACPVTPKENRLDLRIEAGERGFKLPPDERAG